MDEIRTQLMKNLRHIIATRGLKQADIADALGVTQGSVSNWLNGYASPDLAKLIELCRYLDISMDALTGTNTKSDADELAALLVSLSPEERQLTRDFISLLLKAQQKP
ncbi:MAG: helix-turn-helix transcriptional regulator [Clostridia bacterium]|nr:helix-turn-helix transcriptional regulator [Clostridia bacterium]